MSKDLKIKKQINEIESKNDKSWYLKIINRHLANLRTKRRKNNIGNKGNTVQILGWGMEYLKI